MSKKKISIVVGMGIGELYKQVLTDLGHYVVTVDSNPERSADFPSVEFAIHVCRDFDTAHICTPNFTHEELARKLANKSKIVLIEKPGVINSTAWINLIKDFPNTRFYMVKNNQYREEMETFKDLYSKSKSVSVCWKRKNCIPNPGSWFTTKSQAYGGVSRDLIPHMLSYYTAMEDFELGKTIFANSQQRHNLESIKDTEYGIVNREGTYDVDDFCEITLEGKLPWSLVADWKSDSDDNSSINFDTGIEKISFNLGWCPEYAYKKMIQDLIINLNNNDFWIQQNKQDVFIHKQIETL